MRLLKFVPLAVALGLLFTASAQAQHYIGWKPYYGPLYPAQAQPAAYAQPAPMPMSAPEEPPLPESDRSSPSCTSPATGCTAAAGSDCDCEACSQFCWPTLNLPCPPPGWYGGMEYNMWWTKARQLPPLVTTGATAALPNTTMTINNGTILFGNGPVGDDVGGGGRMTVGRWLDPQETVGVAGRFWAFRANDGEYAVASDANLPNLGVPFFNAFANAEDAYIVAYGVGPATGSVDIQDRIDMTGLDLYAQFLLYGEPGTRFDFLMGYQLLRLDNSLEIDTHSFSNIPPLVNTSVDTQDLFETQNEFHGFQIGLSTTSDWNRWTFDMAGKVSIGNMRQRVYIDGDTIVTVPGPVVSERDEGIFALGTNSGSWGRDRISFIPEVNLKLGYRVRDNVIVSMGYTFMYINNVVLAGDQLDRRVNPTQLNGAPLVGAPLPAFLGFRETDFWAQGINFGVDVRF